MCLTTACRATCISSLDYQCSFLLYSSHSNHPRFALLYQAHSEEVSQERNERQRLERDLEEASRRLAMAHQDIRRLTNELDAAKNNNLDPSGMLQRLSVYPSKKCESTLDYVMFPNIYAHCLVCCFCALLLYQVVVGNIHMMAFSCSHLHIQPQFLV